ncbi:prolyl 4-hydroxylase [Desmophyllum pertusum]|uniref:Prolyl 4-hydroxylase n=1 Tax=Desmophyllum pertusum TaxID=174260 RepID=A0A9W9YP32_9CNID|nr:prolyl 4-hydroxylase [Desmophyllum pertusum]
MEICNLVETLFVICVFFVCQDVLSLRLNYPPKIGADENVCFLEWTSSARCESGTQPAYEGRLFRFDGKKVGNVKHVHLVAGKTHEMITRALKPPVFEIPNFLTKEECEHLIQKAKETGLILSEVALPEELTTTPDKFASSCYDDDYRCVKWAKIGECAKNPGYMLEKCRQSCEVCMDERTFDFDNWDLDKDGILTGYEFIKAAEMHFFLYLDEFDVHEMFLVLNVTQFGSGHVCDDNDEAWCSQLAQEGACDMYPVWMLLTCRKTCGNCGCEDSATNCSSLAKEEKCLHDDHVDWMLRNCRRSCKVCLGAINYETYEEMDTNDIFKYVKTMERKHPKHRARYSHTAWLHSTIQDPIQNRMIDRVEKLTKLPREIVEGAESLQVVKYDKYGHYHAHYDTSSTGDVTMICCHQTRNKTQPCRLCRIVTILYYLNDVDEGGETAFIVADNSTLNESMLISKRGKKGDPFNLSNYCQEANLVIAPKRGTAIMWYNHLLDSKNEWLGERDPYTLHGGCDVRRGMFLSQLAATFNAKSTKMQKYKIILGFVKGFLVQFGSLESTALKNKRIIRPCFEEDLAKCSSPADSCENVVEDGDFKLIRLQGIRTGHVRWLELEEGRSYKLITRAMKPLLFEIPDFLTDGECEHVISLAKETGLSTSKISRQLYDRDLDEVMKEADSNATLDQKYYFARDFNVWDSNKDGVIDIQEIKRFAQEYKTLHLKHEEIIEMLRRSGITDNPIEGKITVRFFSERNIKKILSYMAFLKSSSPRHKFRFSDQAWLRQDKTADHVLRRLHERIVKLTKLPRKLLHGSETMQVVRYQTFGHYHGHYDSSLDPDIPCCHQNPSLKPPQCRLCRFITILYYLNDVEQGGETAFPVADNSSISWKGLRNPEADELNLSISCHSANLVLPPNKGTAIMWYNNFIDPDSGLLGIWIDTRFTVDVTSLKGKSGLLTTG